MADEISRHGRAGGDGPDDEVAHPTRNAALLMIGVVVVIIVLSLLSIGH